MDTRERERTHTPGSKGQPESGREDQGTWAPPTLISTCPRLDKVPKSLRRCLLGKWRLTPLPQKTKGVPPPAPHCGTEGLLMGSVGSFSTQYSFKNLSIIMT